MQLKRNATSSVRKAIVFTLGILLWSLLFVDEDMFGISIVISINVIAVTMCVVFITFATKENIYANEHVLQLRSGTTVIEEVELVQIVSIYETVISTSMTASGSFNGARVYNVQTKTGTAFTFSQKGYRKKEVEKLIQYCQMHNPHIKNE